MGYPSLPDRIVLIGPSGSGKSELARRLAMELGYEAVDTDALIEERIRMPVFEFFASFGEAAFRAIEKQVVREVSSRTRVVIATGGGVVTEPENWTVIRPGSAIIGLHAEPETLVSRVQAQAAGNVSAVRPLLAGDALSRIRQQLAVRDPLYRQADVVIPTDNLDPDEVSAAARDWLLDSEVPWLAPSFTLPGVVERSDIYVGRGSSLRAGELVAQRWPRSRHVWIVTDSNVRPHWADEISDNFQTAGFTTSVLEVPAGEASKSFKQVESLCAAITAERSSRQDVVVALGGGVVGDLAGLVASICLRGLTLVQMPTSLLAMVDSSVGGKTGINTASGKNLVGTFNQPAMVLVDSRFLQTLPTAEYRSGMAEVIKHSVIQPSTPLGGRSLSDALAALPSLAPVPENSIDNVLESNVGIKHSVVQADERESGLRMILNFGHTTGHAIEADGYRYRHGEAVGLGMLVAGRIALEMERVNRLWVDQLTSRLAEAGLPVTLEGKVDAVIERLAHDKKNVNGSLNWVLPREESGVEIVSGVGIDSVRRALRDLGAT